METVEDGIYVVVAVLLVIAGLFVLWSAVASLPQVVSQKDPLPIVVDFLDRGLILFIIAELLHTVRVTIQSRTLAAEPFLIVAIIAGIRRILIITAQAAQEGHFSWSQQGIELSLLTVLVIVMTAAVIAWRRFYAPLAAADADA